MNVNTLRFQVLESELSVNGEKLLCQGVPGRLWREHSPRSFLPTCTGCLRYPKNWQDAIGGWSPGQAQAYVRTTRRRLSIMQSTVAKLLRDGRKDELGERDLEEGLMAHLTPRLQRRSGSGTGLQAVESQGVHCKSQVPSVMKKSWHSKEKGRWMKKSQKRK